MNPSNPNYPNAAATIAIVAFCLSAAQASGEQSGLFTYSVSGDAVTITDYPEDGVGEIEIPAEIEGLPVTGIGSSAFSHCNGLTGIIIPDGVTTIGSEAFWRCESLTGIDLPESVTMIEQYAFGDCISLTSISIPQMVEELHYHTAFSGCVELTSILVDQRSTHFTSEDGVLFTTDMSEILKFPPGKEGVYAIPTSVTSFGYAFSGCVKCTGVTIPDSVTNIGTGAFRDCRALTSVTIPSSVTEIGYYAFDGCSGLTSVIIPPGVTHIAEGTFSGCSGLLGVSIPSGVTSIGDYVFNGCIALSAIEVDPRNLSYSSEEGVLFNATRTTLITCPQGKRGAYAVPEGVTSIQGEICIAGFGCFSQGAFQYCRLLTSIAIPSSVIWIGGSAFRGCDGLASVSIGSGVEGIGDGAFSNSSLHSAIFLGDAPSNFDGNTFANAAPDFTIYYLSCSTGFTSPTWNGYPAVRIDEQTCPAAPWLVSHGLPYDTDLHQDLNGDGVSVLMAYALDLDPQQQLGGRLPTPVLQGDQLRMPFHAASPGILYTVETSTDLRTWTDDSVAISELDAENRRTASVGMDSRQRFLRLVVSENR